MPDITHLQFGCFLVTLILAIYIAMSRLFVVTTVKRYEQSRWLLFSGLLLLTVHFLLQMKFNFRLQGADVATLINILFYTPATFLISYAFVNIRSDESILRFYRSTAISCHVLVYSVVILGLLIYGNLHLDLVLTALYVIFALTMLFFIAMPLRQIFLRYKEYGNSHPVDRLTKIRSSWICLALVSMSSILIIFSLLSNTLLYIFGPILLLTLIAYVTSFISALNNMTFVQNLEYVNTVYGNGETSDNTANGGAGEKGNTLTEEREEFIRSSLQRWCDDRGYRDNTITLKILARRLAVSRSDLSIYFDQVLHSNFRVWLSDVRFQAAKNIIMEHPEYSNETISAECGFSSRSQLYKIFKDNLGMSPGDWKLQEQRRLEAEQS